jgi:hypothetical protein
MKPSEPDLASRVKAVKDKVDAIKAVFSLSPPDQGMYRPLLVAFGGTAGNRHERGGGREGPAWARRPDGPRRARGPQGLRRASLCEMKDILGRRPRAQQGPGRERRPLHQVRKG